MRKRTLIAAIVALLGLLSVAGFAFYQSSTATTVFDEKDVNLYFPVSPTNTDIENFGRNLIFGTDDPTTIVQASDEGWVRGTLTGLELLSGERQFIATVIDDNADIDHAEIYIDGVLTMTATRANGGVVDRPTKAIATMNVMIPPATSTFTVEVRWISNAGQTRSHIVTV